MPWMSALSPLPVGVKRFQSPDNGGSQCHSRARPRVVPPVGQAVAAGAHLRDNARQLKNIGLPVEPADGLGVRRVQWG
jgi:hypothetical protein